MSLVQFSENKKLTFFLVTLLDTLHYRETNE